MTVPEPRVIIIELARRFRAVYGDERYHQTIESLPAAAKHVLWMFSEGDSCDDVIVYLAGEHLGPGLVMTKEAWLKGQEDFVNLVFKLRRALDK